MGLMTKYTARPARRLLLMVLCLTGASLTGCASANKSTFVVPFLSTNTRDVGGGATTGVIRLPYGEEQKTVSRAIMLALGDRLFSIDVPADLETGEPLPMKVKIRTDAVDLTQDAARTYNREQHRGFRIPNEYKYRLRYDFSYAIKDLEIIVDVWAVLEYAGAVSRWQEYQQPYSGKYFADQLRHAIESRLKTGPAEPASP